MRDIDIRNKIKKTYLKKYYTDNDSLVIDEFNVSYGIARMDIAVINGALHGFEIKSDFDNLKRLPHQITTYSKTFDYLTVVVGQKHLISVLELVPEWCGIMVASPKKKNDGLKLVYNRKPKRNFNTEKLSVAQLLWREEALEALSSKGIKKGLSSKPKPFLWNLITENFTITEISNIVRNSLKLRAEWRSDLSLFQNDDYTQLASR